MSNDALEKFCKGNDTYTPEQVKQFIGSAHSFACMAVMTYARDLLEHKGLHDLAATIAPMIAKEAGHVTLRFKETDNTFRITLDIGRKDYAKIPMLFNDAYLDDLQDKYRFCTMLAVTYWGSFIATAPPDFLDALPADMRELKQDEKNPISLYFDPKYSKRIVVFGCYVNVAGEMLVERGGKRPALPS
jgi:hypothetical protein